MTTVIPRWLEAKAETSRRAAKPDTCPTCHAPTLTGPDHDTCAITTHIDPTPVDPLHEAVALLGGRHSYNLAHGQISYREPEQTQAAHNPHPIHLDHKCVNPPETTCLF